MYFFAIARYVGFFVAAYSRAAITAPAASGSDVFLSCAKSHQVPPPPFASQPYLSMNVSARVASFSQRAFFVASYASRYAMPHHPLSSKYGLPLYRTLNEDEYAPTPFAA